MDFNPVDFNGWPGIRRNIAAEAKIQTHPVTDGQKGT
jgi:hypothetical protein